jgi:hypothetical protein
MGVAAPVPSLSYNSFEFIVFAYGLSVQDCSGPKRFENLHSVFQSVSATSSSIVSRNR